MQAIKRDVRRTYRVFFETYGNGPWKCDVCMNDVLVHGQGTWDGNIHHRDGDKLNDDPDNLMMMHTICHLRLHTPDEEMRKRISTTLRGRPSPTRGMRFSPETNRKKSRLGTSNPFYGKTHSAEALHKMRAPRRRVICEECQRDVAINWLTRHECVS